VKIRGGNARAANTGRAGLASKPDIRPSTLTLRRFICARPRNKKTPGGWMRPRVWCKIQISEDVST
jgi:hypothetical protein